MHVPSDPHHVGSPIVERRYSRREPKKSPLWQVVNRHYGEFEKTHAGPLRPEIPEVIDKYLGCGDVRYGYTEIRCENCRHQYLLPLSCKCRGFCPSCHQKYVKVTAQFITESVLLPVPHRHYVLTTPKLLRSIFKENQHLLPDLFRLAHESLSEYLRTALGRQEGSPGIILALHTFGEFLDFHPHIHAVVADGLFVQNPIIDAHAAMTTTNVDQPTIEFLPLPKISVKPLEYLFRAKIIHFLVVEKVLSDEQVRRLYSWHHSGFNVHAGEVVPAGKLEELEHLVEYILRNAFSVEKISLNLTGDQIIYHSGIKPAKIVNPKIQRNFQIFSGTGFVAAITQHIPEKGAQRIRYFGQYSNKTRGMRKVRQLRNVEIRQCNVSCKLRSRRWRQVILRVWHADPLCCPVCGKTMRVVGVFENRKVVERVLRSRKAWHDPPAALQPSKCSGGNTYEPCDDVDPMPDYEALGE